MARRDGDRRRTDRHPGAPSGTRDPRIDFLRGLSLLSIFVDHIPDNRLADYTLHNLGFSDAAELFVLLAGFSATAAYGRVFERDGMRVGITKVFMRCLRIYGAQVCLLLLTMLVVSVWNRWFGMESVILGPMLRDGLKGTLRGLALEALPTYLDILPLYILLLVLFPLIRFGLARSVPATLGVSLAVHALANLFHWDLPSAVDPSATTAWYFNPFTWQLVFVFGAAFAIWSRRGARLMTAPPAALLALCWAYVVVAFVALDAWKLWPLPFGPDFPSTHYPFAFFGNEPKSFVTPWRLFNVLAITYLALTSARLTRIARSRLARPIVACGQNSLTVFAAASILALFGRLIFKTAGVTVATEVPVNLVGLSTMIAVGLICAARSAAGRSRVISSETPADAPGTSATGADPHRLRRSQ